MSTSIETAELRNTPHVPAAPFSAEVGKALTQLPGLQSRPAAEVMSRWQAPDRSPVPTAGPSLMVELRPQALLLKLWREKGAELSTAIRRSLGQLAEAATHDNPLLLVGERSTGRRDAARALHQLGARSAGPFVAWRNLADVPGELGQALTLSAGGTLYLGEIERLSEDGLRACAREVARGSSALDSRSVRLVAACAPQQGETESAETPTASLLAAFGESRVEIPALRRRRADLPLLIDFLLTDTSARLGRAPPSVSPSAQKAMRSYGWPGNLAELQTCLSWAVLACAPSSEVQLWDLPLSVRGGSAGDRSTLLAEMVGALERTAIVEALGQSGNKKIHAATLLGISRPTLDKKIADYKIRFKRSAV